MVYFAAALFVCVGPPGQALNFIKQEMSVDGRIVWADGRDLNGDKRADLVVVLRRGVDPKTERFIDIFYQTAAGLYPEHPNEELKVPPDATFAQLEDLHGNGRAEVVLVTARGISSFSWNGSAMVPAQVLEAPTPTQFSEPEDLPLWHFVDDWHRRGVPEIALPRVGSVQFYRPKADGTFEPAETIAFRPNTYLDGMGGTFTGAWSNRVFSISVAHVFPELLVGDYDGDKHPDLFALSEDRLEIFSGDGQRFSPTAKVALDFGLRTAEERQRRNAYVAGTVIDLNGDGLLDYVANKVSGGLSAMHSETRIHLNHGGYRRTADQTLKRDGFSAMVQFVDLDRDGLPEMIEPSAEVGLFTLARAMVSKRMTVTWLITHNEAGNFAPSHAQKIPIVYALDFSGGAIFRGPFPRFRSDYNGDGFVDFMSSADGTELTFNLGQQGSFESAPSARVKMEVSPYTLSFVDLRTHRPQVLTFFRDVPDREGKITLLLNGLNQPSRD